MANSVYDPDTEGEQRYHPPNPDPKDNKPAGDPSDPRTIHKSPVEEKKDETEPHEDLRNAEESGGDLFNPEGDRGSEGSPAGGLMDREKGESAGGDGFKFNASDKGGRAQQAMKFLAKHKKGVGIGVGAGGGLAGIVLMIFFLLVPLKIEHMVKNLEKRFFATSENAVERQTGKMFTRYMSKYVFPSYAGRCGTTRDRHCTVRVRGRGPVSHLYRTWANARLETKLANNYKIEFKYDTQSRHWRLKAPGTNPGGDDIGEFGKGLETNFERGNRTTMRRAVNDAFKHETRWKRMMYRYKVGRLLEEKYGLKRCIIFCGVRDKFADKKDAKLRVAKLKLVQRVITPHTKTLGIVMECLISDCHPTKTRPISAEDGSTTALAGNPENEETDSTIRRTSNRLAAAFAGESAEHLIKRVDRIRKVGYFRTALEIVLKKVGLKELGKNISSAVPIVGWVNRAAFIISIIDHIGPALKKLGYIASAGAAVQLYQMYRTYADEIHTGNVDATEIGSFTDSLGPGDRGTPSDPQVGGTAGAEDTPLYANLIDNKPAGSTTAFNGLLPAKAYAASGNGGSSSYRCNNNKPVPAGKLVCPEEVLGGGNEYLNRVHNILHTAPLSYITTMANAWAGTIGRLFIVVGDIIGWIINHIPGLRGLVNSVASFIAHIVQPFFEFLVGKLLPSPWSTNMSGGRTFDMMAAGADVAGNDYAHTGLGGKRLNPHQVAAIVNEHRGHARQSFEDQPFFARMFDTDSSHSLITKIAMAIPFGTQAKVNSGLATLASPLSAIGHGFASIFSGRALAAVTAQPDPFGVVQYGYTSDDLNKIGDPETYWQRHCSNNAAHAYMKTNAWNEAAAHYDTNSSDDPGGMPVNVTTNPCLLIKATTGIAGGYMDTSNLTADDLADVNSSSGSVSGSTVSGNAQELAQQILDNNKISKAGRHVTEDLQNMADGKHAYGNVDITINILRFLADLGQNTSYTITSITGAGSGHSPNSNHYSGNAVDLGCPMDENKGDESASKYDLKAENERCENTPPGNKHMHYSKDGF